MLLPVTSTMTLCTLCTKTSIIDTLKRVHSLIHCTRFNVSIYATFKLGVHCLPCMYAVQVVQYKSEVTCAKACPLCSPLQALTGPFQCCWPLHPPSVNPLMRHTAWHAAAS